MLQLIHSWRYRRTLQTCWSTVGRRKVPGTCQIFHESIILRISSKVWKAELLFGQIINWRNVLKVDRDFIWHTYITGFTYINQIQSARLVWYSIGLTGLVGTVTWIEEIIPEFWRCCVVVVNVRFLKYAGRANDRTSDIHSTLDRLERCTTDIFWVDYWYCFLRWNVFSEEENIFVVKLYRNMTACRWVDE